MERATLYNFVDYEMTKHIISDEELDSDCDALMVEFMNEKIQFNGTKQVSSARLKLNLPGKGGKYRVRMQDRINQLLKQYGQRTRCDWIVTNGYGSFVLTYPEQLS